MDGLEGCSADHYEWMPQPFEGKISSSEPKPDDYILGSRASPNLPSSVLFLSRWWEGACGTSDRECTASEVDQALRRATEEVSPLGFRPGQMPDNLTPAQRRRC